LRNAFYKHSAPPALWEQRVCQQYPERRRSKGSAELIYAHTSFFYPYVPVGASPVAETISKPEK
jgi:hypothetical protein